MRDRYGGDVGKPTFSAGQIFIYYVKFKILKEKKEIYIHINYYSHSMLTTSSNIYENEITVGLCNHTHLK